MIFKKQISILIAFLVLVSNSGLAFNVHFCKGKIAAISSVFSNEEICDMPIEVKKNCCAKAKPTPKKCCSDKEVNLKNKAEKIIIKTISLDFEPAFFNQYNIQTFVTANAKSFSPNKVAFYCKSNAPPLYKLYCQYTFYS